MTAKRLSTVAAALAAAALGLVACPAARAEDRSDPIPTAVGPPGGVGFYVNPTAPGLDAARVQEIIRRSLARWGNTYLGTTTNAPGAADGQNVIGVGDLPPGVLGLEQSRSTQSEAQVAATQACVAVGREPSHTVRRRTRTSRVRLRRDRVVGGRVRRASVSRRLRRPLYTRVTAPATAQQCTIGAATTERTAALEFDVTLRPAPQSGPWQLGPALPTGTEFDFETNALHEIGHVSGLAHQLDECDPSTPLPASQEPTEFWHAALPGQWFRPAPCPANPSPPAPIVGSDSAEPLPGAGATALAGHSVLINPKVPAGYDSARFVAVADRAIRRAGGTPGGLTDVAPRNGDGTSVLGFATLSVGTLTSSTRTPRQQVVQAYTVRSCRRARVRVRRQVVARRLVVVGGLRLRRDAITTARRTVSGYRCTKTTRPAVTTALPAELDLRVNDHTIAWELGPRFPVDGTRWDLETSLLQNVMGAGNVPSGTACDTTTPNSSSGAAPGDWWRSTAEVRRTSCLAGPDRPNREARRTPRAGAGAGLVHRAAGLPADVRHLPD